MHLATLMGTQHEDWKSAITQMVHSEISSDLKPLLTETALHSQHQNKRTVMDKILLCQEDSAKTVAKCCSIYMYLFRFLCIQIPILTVPS